MPEIYKPPLGLPFHWQHEVSGRLATAVTAYLDNRIHKETIAEEDVTILREYLVHYINAPCWNNEEFASQLTALRSSAPTLDSATKISEWIWDAMEIGLDPL